MKLTSIFKYAPYIGEFHPLRGVSVTPAGDLAGVIVRRGMPVPEGYTVYTGEYPALIPYKDTTVYILSGTSLAINTSEALVLTSIPDGEKEYYHKETYLPPYFPQASAPLIAECYSGAKWLSYSMQGIISPRGFKPNVPKIVLDLAMSAVTSYKEPNNLPEEGPAVIQPNVDLRGYIDKFLKNGVDLFWEGTEYCKYWGRKNSAVLHKFRFLADSGGADPLFANLRRFLVDSHAREITVNVRDPSASCFPPQDFSELSTNKPLSEITVTPDFQKILVVSDLPLKRDLVAGKHIVRAQRPSDSEYLPLYHTPYGALIPRCFPEREEILVSPFSGKRFTSRKTFRRCASLQTLENKYSFGMLPREMFRNEVGSPSESEIRGLGDAMGCAYFRKEGLAVSRISKGAEPRMEGDNQMAEMFTWAYAVFLQCGNGPKDFSEFLRRLVKSIPGAILYLSPVPYSDVFACYFPQGSLDMGRICAALPENIHEFLSTLFSVPAIDHFRAQHLAAI